MNPEQFSLLSGLKQAINTLPTELQYPSVLALIRLALAEDLSARDDLSTIATDIPAGDITSSASVPVET